MSSDSNIDYPDEVQLLELKSNTSLLAFRITQFVWYGGGVLPSVFLGIFLTQRGLTLVEISSVFSVIFLFQLLASSVTGIIADKIGSAKPVLMFLMVSAVVVLVLMLITPNINKATCISGENFLRESSYSKNYSFCYKDCLIYYKNNFSVEQKYNISSVIDEQDSFVDINDDVELNNNSQNVSYLHNVTLTNISFNSLTDECRNACISNAGNDCVATRDGYIIAIYSALIIAFYSVYSTSYRFMNFTAVSMAEQYNSHYGKELAVAKSADLLVITIVAFVLNIDKSSGPEINFDLVISIGAGIMFCSFLTSFAVTAPILPPGKNLTKKALNLVRDTDTLVFIILSLIAGSGSSFYGTFHLVFLKTMNPPSIVVSLHTVAINLYGLLLLLKSKWLLNKFGTHKIFILGLFFNGVNFVACSYIYNAWWSLLIDVCVAFAHDLYSVAVVQHCWRVAPVGFTATYIALIGTVQHGIGRSSGVFFGGMMMHYMGPRRAYRVMAAIYFVSTVLYSMFAYKKHKSVASQ